MQNRIWLLPVMVTGTNRVSHEPGQRRGCSKLMLTAFTCDYLTALVILATAVVVKTAVWSSPAFACLASLACVV